MLSTISVATPEVDSRLTHPPNVSFEDIARYWGEILNKEILDFEGGEKILEYYERDRIERINI